ncbi:MAG: hypothetical protein AAGF95_34085 [Chloroflexota bacterium]
MEAVTYDISWFENIRSQRWIKQLGLPQEILDDPFALNDHALAAILSLMGAPGALLITVVYLLRLVQIISSNAAICMMMDIIRTDWKWSLHGQQHFVSGVLTTVLRESSL